MTCHRNSSSAKSALHIKKVSKSMLKSILLVDFFDQVIKLDDLEEREIHKTLMSYTEKKRTSDMNKDGASNHRYHQRRRWLEFQAKLTNRQFYGYF